MDTELVRCSVCGQQYEKNELDFLERCLVCFRRYVDNPPPARPLLFQSTHNPHNPKETKAYVERLERKRLTPQGVDHNYQKRIYG